MHSPDPIFIPLTLNLISLSTAFLENGVLTRDVLRRYSYSYLSKVESLVSTSAFISYSLWASGPTLNGASNSLMLLTVPFVLIGICRYQFLCDTKELDRRKLLNPYFTSEKPEEILLRDRGIKIILVGWLLVTFLIGTFC